MRSAWLILLPAAALLIAATPQNPNAIAFDLDDPKGVTGMTIGIDAPLEPVRGFAGGITGNLLLNLKDPKKSTGKVIVAANSTELGRKNMTGAMHQGWCLDVKKYPTIEFSVKEVLEVKKGEGDTYTAKVAGDFLFHGITKPLTIDATVKYLPGKLKARGGMEKDGDIVQIYSKFSVNRLDFDVAPDLSTDLIGNKIDIDLALTGIAVR